MKIYGTVICCGAILMMFQQTAWAQDPSNPAIYQLSVDGKNYEVQDGTPMNVTLQNGQTIRVQVGLKRQQPYRTSTIRFEYDSGMSLTDDKTETERTITLLHASGCGLVITDQGLASESDQKELISNIVEGMLDMAKRGTARDITKEKISPVSFRHAKGLQTSTSHLDEDNDRMTYQYFVLQSGTRLVSVIGFFNQNARDLYSGMQSILLDTIDVLPASNPAGEVPTTLDAAESLQPASSH